MKITVLGTGYLGATHAACLASLGHDVLGVDIDPVRVDSLNNGHSPVLEPGLDDLLTAGLQAGRLRFTTSVTEAADHARVHFLCVGTPQSADSWEMDLSAVDSAVDELVAHLDHGDHLIVGKSTVPAGTAQGLQERMPERVAVCWNPEFLREGHGIADTLQPDRIVLGIPDTVAGPAAGETVREIYADLGEVPFLVTDLTTAELVKVSANAFLATKISFINAVADLCEATGGDVSVLSTALGLDPRIGPGALSAGLGFGGGCLPKDLRGLTARAEQVDARQAADLFRAVDAENMHRRDRLVDQVTDACGGSVSDRRITVLGASFKPGSDDIRDSPAMTVIGDLEDAGGLVTVCDPAVPGYSRDLSGALRGAEVTVIATDWPEFRDLDPVAARDLVAVPTVVDGRNCLPVARWTDAGWDYRGTGRRAQSSGWNPASTASTAN
ncbi:UDP-glucose dehydrogenase family protein [Corynebacterium variabile]|uniref:UDP-glucose dehydrogenase family protein n=1 Tax=Corynebacterium variabile TaxID=1727 RepID=UPI0028A5F4DE|nr:UDP-glucose/GDP-mannose dehydrogenase family protein [Corynebacterium variabile]